MKQNDAKLEFNALADLIVESAAAVEKDNFKLNLFGSKPTAGSSGGGSSTGYENDDMIHIDLTENTQKQKEKLKEAAK